MSRSRSRRVVLLLDCCYAGAFERGLVARSGTELGIEQQFGGRGRAVITASSAMEYAFEAGELTGERDVPPSAFTSALVQGWRPGTPTWTRTAWWGSTSCTTTSTTRSGRSPLARRPASGPSAWKGSCTSPAASARSPRPPRCRPNCGRRSTAPWPGSGPGRSRNSPRCCAAATQGGRWPPGSPLNSSPATIAGRSPPRPPRRSPRRRRKRRRPWPNRNRSRPSGQAAPVPAAPVTAAPVRQRPKRRPHRSRSPFRPKPVTAQAVQPPTTAPPRDDGPPAMPSESDPGRTIPPEARPRWAGRRRAAITAGAVAVIAVIAAVVAVILVPGPRPHAQPPRAGSLAGVHERPDLVQPGGGERRRLLRQRRRQRVRGGRQERQAVVVLPDRRKVRSSPVVVDGVVYVGSDDDKVYALNATAGKRLWSYPIGNKVSPARRSRATWSTSAR